MEIPERLELDVSGMAIGDTLRLADLPALEGVTYLDDPEETVLANVTRADARSSSPEPEEGEELPRARRCPRARRLRRAPPRLRRSPATRPASGSEGEPAPRSSRCASSVGARAASTLDLLVAGLGNPGREYAAHAAQRRLDRRRRAGAAARRLVPRRSSPGSSPRCALDDARVALLKPETYMNESGRSIGGRAAVLQGRAGRRCSSSTTTSISRRGASRRGSAAGSPATTGCARSRRRSASQDFLRLRIGVGRPGRGDRRPVADYVLSPFEPEVDVDAPRRAVGGRRRDDRRATGSRPPRHASTESAFGTESARAVAVTPARDRGDTLGRGWRVAFIRLPGWGVGARRRVT